MRIRATEPGALREAVTAKMPPAPQTRPLAASTPADFSLVRGGLLFQTFQRAHLCGDSFEFLHRRVVAMTLLTWVPLLPLSAIDGNFLRRSGAIGFPFLHDFEAQARFLIALPMLLVAEVFIHERISPLARRFVERRIIETGDLPAFNAAVASTMRACNSIAWEAALLVLVYTLGFWLWQRHVALDAATWYARPAAGRFDFTLAGYWYAFTSIPIFQFMLLRLYLRMVLWFQFLWRVSRLNLHLTAAHPDRAGGIGFLGDTVYAFSPMVFAQGALLSGLIATRVLYAGQSLTSFKEDAAGLVCAVVLFVLGPLVMFTPQLDRARRKGRAQYGVLANRYVFQFEAKWMSRGGQDTGDLLGSSDIQSLGDLATSTAVVRGMRLVPFVRDDVVWLAAVTAAPLLPLALTMFSLQELLTRLVKLLI